MTPLHEEESKPFHRSYNPATGSSRRGSYSTTVSTNTRRRSSSAMSSSTNARRRSSTLFYDFPTGDIPERRESDYSEYGMMPPHQPGPESAISRRRSIMSTSSPSDFYRGSSSTTASSDTRRQALSTNAQPSSSTPSYDFPGRRRSDTNEHGMMLSHQSGPVSTIPRRRSVLSTSRPSDFYHQEDVEFAGRRVLVLHRTRHMQNGALSIPEPF